MAQFETGFRVQIIQVAAEFSKFKAGLPKQLEILARHGWFVSGDHTPLSAIYPAASLFQSGQNEKIEEGHRALCLHFDHDLPAIETGLLEDFPNRARILGKAFAAHRANDFELCIPVFLAQADGIARDTIPSMPAKSSVYSQQPKVKCSIESFIDDFVDEKLIVATLLKVALLATPLNASEGHQMLSGNDLNRHRILHGTDTAYASPLNSYRAISWLEFVSYLQRFSK